MPDPSARQADASVDLLACLLAALQAPDWQTSAAEIVSEVNQRLGCLRVSMGWLVSGQLRVMALSDGVVVDDGAAMPELQQAMLEAMHQRATLVWPSQGRSETRITLAHQTLYKTQGLAGVLTVPLAQKGRVVGVLTCERSVVSDPLSPHPMRDRSLGEFSQEEIRWVEQLAVGLAPLMVLRHKLDRPWTERLRSAVLLSLIHI